MTPPRTAQTLGQPLAGLSRSNRPWGNFDQFVQNQAVTVKIITVAPLQRLSLQRHTQRDEFWQVIDGRADIEVGGHSSSLDAGGRAWIPRGSTHRLGNRGDAPVRILEIAFGHFDEEDIERLVDDYDRATVPTQVPAAGLVPGMTA